MAALKNLEQELGDIDRALQALEGYVEAARHGGAARHDLWRLVDLLEAMEDAHQAKEEQILFAALSQRRGPALGPVAALTAERARGRRTLRALRALTAESVPWDARDLARLAKLAGGYTEMRRAELRLEERNLLPVARSRLGAKRLEELDRQLARFDEDRRRERERLQDVEADLVRRYAAGSSGGARSRSRGRTV